MAWTVFIADNSINTSISTKKFLAKTRPQIGRFADAPAGQSFQSSEKFKVQAKDSLFSPNKVSFILHILAARNVIYAMEGI